MSGKTREARQARAEARRKAVQRRQRRRRLLLAGVFVAVFAGVIGATLAVTGKSGSQKYTTAPNSPPTVQQPAVRVGGLFPDFRVADADGRVVTRDSLRGKTTIVWYTTSYCVPCQVGATAVASLDDQMGGRAFNVLVVFVDPGESTAALTNWRAQFGRPDWMVALDRDGTLSKVVGLQFLDSKFLLDGNGRIENIDFRVADQNYLAVVQRVVAGSA